ncbi:diaminopimelate epimerase [Siminovitchia terrae]|uniref:Diaminopimelate epimerase n=1 Tax=Siminovitchia terrae TaxID=1914933 RepID=A0A429XCL0_SIMTE|nr:diaminopimelate epimerase [Siminovitchia terrae]RST61206.1 diaminopimelate epimerase [Siminovitchia terrae]
MRKVPFKKMHGCGNDFVVIDNRDSVMKSFELSHFVKSVCTRRFHIGADGLMLLEKSTSADFKMRYFNSDGSEGEMCGNGARCIVKYAYLMGIGGDVMTFETLNGIYEGRILNENVQIKFPPIPIQDFHLNQPFPSNENVFYHFAWVGVPHTVFVERNIDLKQDQSFIQWARAIRYNPAICTSGTNVNLIEICDENQIKIRTYERGVEDETLACGSGATASAIISGLLSNVSSPVKVHTKGGILTITFRITEDYVQDIFLEGNAVVVAEGELLSEASVRV